MVTSFAIGESTVHHVEPSARLLDDLAYRLLSAPSDQEMDLQALLARLAHLDNGGQASPQQHLAIARELISAGYPMLAERVARAGLELDGTSPDLALCMALALARLGSSARALVLLQELLAAMQSDHPLFMDAHSLRGRLLKDAAVRSSADPKQQRILYRAAAMAYEFAARARPTHYPVINAATMWLMAGDRTKARALAGVAHRLARSEVDAGRVDCWTAATLGEAALLMGEVRIAEDCYMEAATRANGRRGDLASMHRQLRLLKTHCEIPLALMQSTSVGPVLLYTGHRADPQDGTLERFPPALETNIAAAIRDYLLELRPSVVIGSAASGTDILVLEQAARLGIERHVWLPMDVDSFIRCSVQDGGVRWVERFQDAMNSATRVRSIPTEALADSAMPFIYLREILLGAGILEADRHATTVRGLAVIALGSPAFEGGTADTAARWITAGLQVRKIPLPGPYVGAVDVSLQHSDHRTLRAMLFADMVGYSRLHEPEIQAFPKHFLGMVRSLIDNNPDGVEFSNTWGDGLFIGFKCWHAGARFALQLRERVATTDWPALGLPATTSLRIAMHGGPIFKQWDPILQRENYFGAHVVRAARIEPITATGAIWLTEEMACLLAAGRPNDLSCEYLGHWALAKGYGKSSLYALQRGNAWLSLL